MDRKDFFSLVGNTAAGVCIGCFASCYKPTNVPDNASAQLNIDLRNQLRNVGDYINKGSLIVIRIGTGNSINSFMVLDTVCPHAGYTVQYHQDPANAAKGAFICPGHGSTFDQFGTLTGGPSPNSLRRYGFVVNGNELIIGS
ncbi:MAG: Rieske 2Fe-2S domain-containing protein [Chitinophagaceae bacterium]